MSESIDHSRRGFLTRLRKPVESINQQQTTPRLVARPPHAVDEALFVHLCDGCAKCQQICPNNIIEIDAQLAQLNLDYNECSLCGECVKACSTNALHYSAPVSINLRPHFTQSCNNYLNIDCQQCKGACQNNAILIQPDELPYLNEELCNGCGQCRSSCYANAIVMQLYNPN